MASSWIVWDSRDESAQILEFVSWQQRWGQQFWEHNRLLNILESLKDEIAEGFCQEEMDESGCAPPHSAPHLYWDEEEAKDWGGELNSSSLLWLFSL